MHKSKIKSNIPKSVLILGLHEVISCFLFLWSSNPLLITSLVFYFHFLVFFSKIRQSFPWVFPFFLRQSIILLYEAESTKETGGPGLLGTRPNHGDSNKYLCIKYQWLCRCCKTLPTAAITVSEEMPWYEKKSNTNKHSFNIHKISISVQLRL